MAAARQARRPGRPDSGFCRRGRGETQAVLGRHIPGLGGGRDSGSEAERSQRSSQVSGLGSRDGGALPGGEGTWGRMTSLIFEILLYFSPPDFLVNQN